MICKKIYPPAKAFAPKHPFYNVYASLYQIKMIVDYPKLSDKWEDFEKFLPLFLPGLEESKAYGAMLEDLCIHHSPKHGSVSVLGGFDHLLALSVCVG
ncbi:hypothetical protein [Nostoc sp. C117]|uniref:hypothetical protein n=1 Tax=Nostoc sp. C117 TaxID=3349875 RepID=UPI00370D93DE